MLDPYIIERLRNSAKPVSGQSMARELGLTRVALWKRIETLKAWGYGIEASSRGYTLVHDDGLAPWDFNAPGPVHLYDELPSTMDKAHELARGGAPSGTMVLALRQSSGRDRSGAAWLSPAGGLYLSLILRSVLPPALAGTLVLEAARLSLDLLEKAGVSELSFDWPGALLGRSVRLGGLLLELAGGLGRADYYVLGLGLNVAPLRVPGPKLWPACSGADGGATLEQAQAGVRSGSFVSLGELGGRPVHRASLAAQLAFGLTAWAADPAVDPGGWARLLPEGPRTAVLWTGEALNLSPCAYTARGELLCAGGRLLSVGECVKLKKKGESREYT